MPNVVILYSGGADSRLMLQFALDMGKQPFCLLIDYGQKHIEELEYAERQLSQMNVGWTKVSLVGFDIRSGLTGEAQEGIYDDVNPMNVPARNTIMISLAASFAESMGIHEVWMGADYSDRENLFPDCYQEYIYEMNKLLEKGMATDVKVYAPLLGWTKEMVLTYLEMQFGIREEDLYSGYEKPGESEEGVGC
jgi:7-cyano-7-deazaguanine synthase